MSTVEVRRNRELWNRAAAYWNERHGCFGDEARRELNGLVRELCGALEEKRVLDAGCGTGAMARYLAAGGKCEVAAFDSAERTVVLAQRTSCELRGRIIYAVGDLHAIPFPENRFDVVVCNFVLSDLRGLAEAMTELHRVCGMGGRFVATLVHPVAMIEALEAARRRPGRGREAVLRPLTVSDYFGEEDGLYLWREGLPTRVYHRSIETYCRAVQQAGFQLSALREAGRSRMRRTGISPRFLVLGGIKRPLEERSHLE